MSRNGASLSKSPKTPRSTDCSLKLESMKVESQVIGNQRVPVNSFLDLAHTARRATVVDFVRSFDSGLSLFA